MKLPKKYLPLWLYLLCFASSLMVLYQARAIGLLPMPVLGMDQYRMLINAAHMYQERCWIPEGYRLSPIYTVFLTGLIGICRGNLVAMRVVQAAICALIPVLIYAVCRKIRVGRNTATIAALLFCLYGPAILISLSFLRASLLALCFLCFSYFLVSGFIHRRLWQFFVSGLFAGACILGRENFFLVVPLPLFLLFTAPRFKRHLNWKFPVAAIGGCLLMILPLMSYNALSYGSFAIIPGNTTNVMTFYYGEAGQSIQSELLRKIFVILPKNLYAYISSFEHPNSLSYYAHRELLSSLTIPRIPFNLIFFLGLAGIWFKRRNHAVLLFGILVSGYIASMLPFTAFYRFRIPAVPLLCCLAAIGISGLAAKSRSLKEKAIVIILILAACSLSWQNPDNLRPASERYSVAAILIDELRLSQAERYITKMDRDGLDTKRLKQQLKIKIRESEL